MAPTALSVCVSNFQKGFIADTRTNWLLFLMEEENGNSWAYIQIFANDWSTSISASMGGVSVPGGKYLPIYFSQSWIRVCISLDMINGTGRIAANGQLLTDSSYPDLIGLKDKRPSKFKIRLGRGSTSGPGIHSKWTDLNMFNGPLEAEDMVAMTTSGDEKCGTPGDFFKWTDMQWTHSTKWFKPGPWENYTLVINASKYIDLQFEDGPCWREPNINVYQIDNLHQHSDCMRHCEKIAGGRVPSLITLADWESFKVNIEAISPHTCAHCYIWMSAVEGNYGTSFDIIEPSNGLSISFEPT